MKTIINILRLSAACAASLLMLASCDTDVESIDINQPSIESQNPELYKQYLGELKAYKEVILNSYKADLQDMEKLVDKVLVRYSEGKDLVTGYKAAVDGVTADSVKKILSLLRGGAEVEYVII